jgi:hypothetical protein
VSLISALTPLVKVAPTPTLWFTCAATYSIAGTVSAAFTGSVLGWLGNWSGLGDAGGVHHYLLGGLGMVLAAREFSYLRFALPQRRCQTEKRFAHEFGFVPASAMWGFHIGLGFFTYMTYGGFWFLAAVSLVSASPVYGAALITLYWSGRAATLWLAPLILSRSISGTDIITGLSYNRERYRFMVGLVLLWAGVIVALVNVR